MKDIDAIALLSAEKEKAKEAKHDDLVEAYSYAIRLIQRQRIIDKICNQKKVGGNKDE